MKRAFFLTVFAVLTATPHFLFSKQTSLQLHSGAAILMDVDSKKILYQKNAFQIHHPASITKLPAALYALKKSPNIWSSYAVADQDTIGSISKKFAIDSKYKYPSHWLVLGGTHIKIHKGEKMRLQDLFYGMLLESANDASNVVAKHVSGSVGLFMEELNVYLKELGCKNTHFKNPHGTHFPNHTTTAYDMAIVTCEALKNAKLREIIKTKQYRIPATNKTGERYLKNYNKLLFKESSYYYPYALGGKTGFNNQAKSTLVVAAKKGNKTLVVVLLQSPTRSKNYEDAIKLFKHGFKSTSK